MGPRFTRGLCPLPFCYVLGVQRLFQWGRALRADCVSLLPLYRIPLGCLVSMGPRFTRGLCRDTKMMIVALALIVSMGPRFTRGLCHETEKTGTERIARFQWGRALRADCVFVQR